MNQQQIAERLGKIEGMKDSPWVLVQPMRLIRHISADHWENSGEVEVAKRLNVDLTNCGQPGFKYEILGPILCVMDGSDWSSAKIWNNSIFDSLGNIPQGLILVANCKNKMHVYHRVIIPINRCMDAGALELAYTLAIIALDELGVEVKLPKGS